MMSFFPTSHPTDRPNQPHLCVLGVQVNVGWGSVHPQTSLTCKFVCVCVCLSLYRSLSLSLCLSVSVSLSLSLFLSLSHPPLARLFPIPTTTTIHRSNIPPGLLFLSLLCLSLSLNRQVKTHSQRARLPPIEPLDILVIGSVRAFPPPAQHKEQFIGSMPANPARRSAGEYRAAFDSLRCSQSDASLGYAESTGSRQSSEAGDMSPVRTDEHLTQGALAARTSSRSQKFVDTTLGMVEDTNLLNLYDKLSKYVPERLLRQVNASKTGMVTKPSKFPTFSQEKGAVLLVDVS